MEVEDELPDSGASDQDRDQNERDLGLRGAEGPKVNVLNAEGRAFLERLDRFEQLEEKVTGKILEKRKELVAIKMLPDLSSVDDEAAEIQAYEHYVAGIFEDFRIQQIEFTDSSGHIDYDKLYDSPAGIEFKYILQLAGEALPITLSDWRVDRVDEAQAALGLKDTASFEVRLCTKYGFDSETAVHVDKGHGDGSMLKKMTVDGVMRQVGIADKAAYFVIRKTLERFIRKDRSKYKPEVVERFVSLLGMLLGRELRDRWFKGNSNKIRSLEGKTTFLDMNEIFGLLAHPQWIAKRIEQNKAKIVSSIEFEDDSKENIDLQVYILLLRFQGMNDDEIGTLVSGHKANRAKARKAKLGRELEARAQFKAKLGRAMGEHEDSVRAAKAASRPEPVFDLDTWQLQWSDIVGVEVLDCEDPKDLLARVSAEVKAKRSEVEDVVPIPRRASAKRTGADSEQSQAFQTLTVMRRLRARCTEENLADSIATWEEHIQVGEVPDDCSCADFLAFMDTEIDKQALNLDPTIVALDLLGKAGGAAALTMDVAPELLDPRMHLLQELFGPLAGRDPVSPAKFLADIFDVNFARTVAGHRSYNLTADLQYHQQSCYAGRQQRVARGDVDLNTHSQFFVHGVISANFTDMAKIFPKDFACAFRASRSDSHEENEEFARDIEDSLPLLRPGGVINTEGLRHSFTRIRRFSEIAAIFERRPELREEYQAQVEMDSETGEVIELFIQRKGPEGYFSDEDKKAEYRDSAVFVTLESVMANPYWQIIDETRRKIYQLADGNELVFKQINDQLEKRLDDLFVQKAMKRWMEMYNIDPSSEDALDQLRMLMRFPFTEALRTVALASIRGSDVDARMVTREDVASIRTDFADIVSKILMSDRVQVKLPAVEGVGLEAYGKDEIHVFARRDSPESPINRHFHRPATELPDNKEFRSTAVRKALESKNSALSSTLADLRGDLGHPPILFIKFTDCDVGELMEEKLRALFGDNFRRFVEVLPVAFTNDPDDRENGLLIGGDPAIFARKLRRYARKGGIVLGVGSWFDSYDQHGRFMKHRLRFRHVADDEDGEEDVDLWTALKTPGSRVRGLGICMTDQLWSDLLGEDFCDGEIVNMPGALEFGPTGVSVLPGQEGHPLFRDCPSRMTLAMTHSGHVHVPGKFLKHPDRSRAFYRPLAVSELTGLPVAAQGPNGMILLQPHPEMDLVMEREPGRVSEDVVKVMAQVEQFKGPLKQKFHLPRMEPIRQNWRLAAEKRPGSSSQMVVANAGDHLIVNALTFLADDLRAEVRGQRKV